MKEFNAHHHFLGLTLVVQIKAHQAFQRALHDHDPVPATHISAILHGPIRPVQNHERSNLLLVGRDGFALESYHPHHTRCFDDVPISFRIHVEMDEDIARQKGNQDFLSPVLSATHYLDSG